MIAYLHVLKGDYDLMLPWPCNIDGNVIIRDLQDFTNVSCLLILSLFTCLYKFLRLNNALPLE